MAAHVAEAKRLAGADLQPLLVLCQPAPATRPAQALVDKLIAAQMARGAPPPGRAFDNLFTNSGSRGDISSIVRRQTGAGERENGQFAQRDAATGE